jgi:O-antigen/teichoic acid export membrane protein
MPELKARISMDRAMVRPLLKFGGWMTVSNVISPLTVSLDRFLIGALISMTAVAYYSTSWEIA